MRWPWRRRRRTDNAERADEAVAASKEALARVDRQWPEVRSVEEGHRRIREHNHFADAFRKALRGGG